VSSAWLSASIQEFEQVTLDNGTELFRVRARARRGDDPEPRPVLVTREDGDGIHTFEPLSSGGDRRGLLRLAYAVPTEFVRPSTAFSLQLPDGYRIELPEPAPGESRAETEDRQRWDDAHPTVTVTDAEIEPRAEPDQQAAERTTQLEQELAELRSANDELRRRLDDVTAEHARIAATASAAQGELASLRDSYRAVDDELRSTQEALTGARSERDAALAASASARYERDEALAATESARYERDEALAATESARSERDEAFTATESARQERDAARGDADSAAAERDAAHQATESARAERDAAHDAAEAARSERDEALEATREERAQHARLTGRLRQLQARIELLRADAKQVQIGVDPRLRRLVSEREQLATHVRALAELLSADNQPDEADGPLEPADANGAADGLSALRARAVRDANEQAERELRRLRATSPH
jgi:chromosome segregation ATPase